MRLFRYIKTENALASRHLREDAQVFYDVSSSYYEGRTCPLANHGHTRDRKKGRTIIVYGVLTDRDGRPVAVEVCPGNMADPSTAGDQVNKLRERLEISHVVLVGRRGMLTQGQIRRLKEYPQLGWISALRSGSICRFVEDGKSERSLFDNKTWPRLPQAPSPLAAILFAEHAPGCG